MASRAARPAPSQRLSYQGILRRSLKSPPLGPPAGNVASHKGVSAPSSTERGAWAYDTF